MSDVRVGGMVQEAYLLFAAESSNKSEGWIMCITVALWPSVVLLHEVFH